MIERRTLFLAVCVFSVAAVFCAPAAASSAAPEPRAGVKEHTDPLIRKHRMGVLTIKTKPGATVKVQQLKHEFHFGTAISARMFRDGTNPRDREKYQSILKTHFNAAVFENALKWYSTERRSAGNPNYRDVDRMLQWCERNGIPVRGHCIFWATPRYIQPWVRELDDEALRKTLERRAKEVTSRYKGRIPEYDLNNEMVHAAYYRDRLGKGIIADMARWAKEGDPEAVLYVNDYNILNGRDLEKYADQIKGFLDQGIPIGGIGCQGHSHRGRMGYRTVTPALDRLGQFRLPIKVTEFLMNTDSEEDKAEGLVDYYRTCFAHPAVEGILMWGFWEGALWRRNAALWKRDWTPNPAAIAYRDLVYKEWWTAWEGKADERGFCEVRAFYGSHDIEAGGEKATVELKRKDGRKSVTVGL